LPTSISFSFLRLIMNIKLFYSFRLLPKHVSLSFESIVSYFIPLVPTTI
jgi:hypothetical protein